MTFFMIASGAGATCEDQEPILPRFLSLTLCGNEVNSCPAHVASAMHSRYRRSRIQPHLASEKSFAIRSTPARFFFGLVDKSI
jgi:hypothetical protein